MLGDEFVISFGFNYATVVFEGDVSCGLGDFREGTTGGGSPTLYIACARESSASVDG